MENKQTTAISIGVIVALILMVFTLVLYFTGYYTQQWTQYVAFVILVAGIGYAVMNHGKENQYTLPFGKLFAFGFKVAAVITCLMIVYTLVSNLVFPDAKEKIIEMAKEQALSKPGANEAQIEAGMKMFSDHYTLFITLGILFWYLVIGVVTSLIAAAITKKKPQNTFEKL